MSGSDSVEAPASGADDVRADIAAAFDSHTPEPAQRDDTGRFAAGDKEPQANDATETGAEAEQETQEGSSEPPGTSTSEKVAAPDGWPSDAKLAWDRLPRAAQEAMRADLDAGRLSLGSVARSNPAPDPVRDVLKNYEPQYLSQGLPPEAAVKALFEAQRMLTVPDPGQRARNFLALAQQNGVSLDMLTSQMAPQGPVDPALAALHQEVAQLKGTLTQQQQAQIAAQEAELKRQVEAFSTEKDADGQLKRPHFAEVRALMGRMIEADASLTMEQAYERAAWATPAIRERMLEAQRKAEEARRKATAEEAKRKAGSVQSNPSVQAKAAAPDDLRTALEAAWGAHS